MRKTKQNKVKTIQDVLVYTYLIKRIHTLATGATGRDSVGVCGGSEYMDRSKVDEGAAVEVPVRK